jgi:hypothetical protein
MDSNGDRALMKKTEKGAFMVPAPEPTGAPFHHHATLNSLAHVQVVGESAIYLARFARCCACMPNRLPPSSSAICITTSHRLASAAKTSAFASAVSTTFDSQYASDDSVTTPPTNVHLDARSDTLAGSPTVLIVPDRCPSVLSICPKSARRLRRSILLR